MKPKYYKDTPKTKSQEDLLRYKKFVEQIFFYSGCFLSEKDSNIIGITANWGDGKTTVLNFLKERFKSQYFKFSFGNLTFNIQALFNFIIKIFIRLLSFAVFLCLGVLSLFAFFKVEQVYIISAWILLVFIVYIFTNFHRFRTSFIQTLKSIFFKTDYILIDFEPWAAKDENHVVDEFFKTLSNNIDLLGNSVGFKRYLKSILKHQNIDFDLFSEDFSLKKIYKNIEESLKKSNKKIIVFIDDMDRMTGKEIYCLLKLVKVVANFPNILYILAYNKQYVIEELRQIITYHPEEYLEKIITNEYRLPNIDFLKIKELLMLELDEIVGQENDNYDMSGIAGFITTIIPDYISNLRKVYRVLNAFNFHYRLFLQAGIMINVKDLLYLTILKIFNLNLYNKLWKEKDNIFNVNLNIISSNDIVEHEKKYIIGNIERKSLSSVDTAIINELFNKNKSKYDVKRLNSENHFSLYFSYELATSQLVNLNNWLKSYPNEDNKQIKFKYNQTMLSDMQDLMYSELYYDYRDTNYALGLIELMMRYSELARYLYIDKRNQNRYFDRSDYIKNVDIKKIVQFIDNNKCRCEINLLEWLLFDCLISDTTSSLTPNKKLPENLETYKISIKNELKSKLEKGNIVDIYSYFTLERLTKTYGFTEIVRAKLLEFLKENDRSIVAMLKQFTGVGYSSNVGIFYNLYIVEMLAELGISTEYYQRLLKIKDNEEIMTDSTFIDYYESSKREYDNEKIHIVDRTLELLGQYENALN